MPMPSRFAVALAVLLAPPAALTAQTPVANRLTMEDFLNAEAPKDFFRGGGPTFRLSRSRTRHGRAATTGAHSPVTAAHLTGERRARRRGYYAPPRAYANRALHDGRGDMDVARRLTRRTG